MTKIMVCCSCDKHGELAQVCGTLDKPCECDCHKAEACVMLTKRVYNQMISALEPFARQARIIDRQDGAGCDGVADAFTLFRFRGSLTAICIGDCRRAGEAIKSAQEDE